MPVITDRTESANRSGEARLMTYGIRRIVFEPARALRKPEKHLTAMRDWADAFKGWYPEDSEEARRSGHIHWHAPVDRRLMDPPWAEPTHCAAAFQLLLDVAGHLRAARPPALSWQRLYVALFQPEAWASEVGIFTDIDYGHGFEDRDHPSQTWTPLNPRTHSLDRDLGLSIPTGFVEQGYHERSEMEDEDEPDGWFIYERDIWMIREPYLPEPCPL